MYNKYEDSIRILQENETLTTREKQEITMMLEDINSPVRMKYNQKLYDSIIDKKHVDFDGIDESKGDITKYSGYPNMISTLDVIRKLDDFQKTNVVNYIITIETAIRNIASLKDLYSRGFIKKTEYVMMEYNALVYACVQGISSILYQYVDIIKRPNTVSEVILKNTPYRANLFFITQLEKFNGVYNSMLLDYRKFLESMIDGDRENFIGTTMITGFATIALVASSVVPISRELVYRHYNSKRKLSESLAQQAYFLELNKKVIESNDALTVDKKKKIVAKQEKYKKLFLTMSEKLRVGDVKSEQLSRSQLINDNKSLTIDKIRTDIATQKLELL